MKILLDGKEILQLDPPETKRREVPLQLEQMEVGLGTGMGHELGLKSGRKGIGVSYLLLRYI